MKELQNNVSGFVRAADLKALLTSTAPNPEVQCVFMCLGLKPLLRGGATLSQYKRPNSKVLKQLIRHPVAVASSSWKGDRTEVLDASTTALHVSGGRIHYPIPNTVVLTGSLKLDAKDIPTDLLELANNTPESDYVMLVPHMRTTQIKSNLEGVNAIYTYVTDLGGLFIDGSVATKEQLSVAGYKTALSVYDAVTCTAA